jgi:hypothetical protein
MPKCLQKKPAFTFLVLTRNKEAFYPLITNKIPMRIAGMALNPNYYVTTEEYLAIERKADSRSEYVDA